MSSYSSLLFLFLFHVFLFVSGQQLRLTDPQRQAFLDGHNLARGVVSSPPAANLRALFWDFNLEDRAQNEVSACGGSLSSVIPVFDGTRNVFSGPTPIAVADALNAFNAPNRFYHYFTPNPCDRDDCCEVSSSTPKLITKVVKNFNFTITSCDTYLQIITQRLNAIGCAYARCGGNDAYICYYDRAPSGTLYVSGLSCSACPGDAPFCATVGDNGQLCVTSAGLLKVGERPQTTYFNRITTEPMMFVGIGFGVIALALLLQYAKKVKLWYEAGETKSYPLGASSASATKYTSISPKETPAPVVKKDTKPAPISTPAITMATTATSDNKTDTNINQQEGVPNVPSPKASTINTVTPPPIPGVKPSINVPAIPASKPSVNVPAIPATKPSVNIPPTIPSSKPSIIAANQNKSSIIQTSPTSPTPATSPPVIPGSKPSIPPSKPIIKGSTIAPPTRPAGSIVGAAIAAANTNGSVSSPALPAGWQIHKDSQGRQYYYNTKTGTSQWTVPKE